MRREAASGAAPGQARTAAGLGATAVDSGGPRPEAPRAPLNGQATGPAAATRFFFLDRARPVRLAGGLRAAPAGLLRLLRRRIRAAAGLVERRWHRSLQLRVVGSTLVISVAVVAVLGIFLIQQIANGLLAHERTVALSQTESGKNFAQTQLGPNAGSFSVLDPIATELQSGSPAGGRYDVVIKSTSSGLLWILGNPSVSPSVPASLQAKVATEQKQGLKKPLWWVPTMLMSSGHKPVTPALAVGVPISAEAQLYYLFPLTQQVQTLQLVQNTLILTGAGLVVLLAIIVSLVTRWVVLPIRQAAQAASKVSAGNLDERMAARGTDDLAALANSFNEMAASLQDKLRELEELSKVQRQFVSDVSHELRTPLTTIRIAADMLFGAKEQLAPDPRAVRRGPAGPAGPVRGPARRPAGDQQA